jgi:hypothetical protein
MPSGVVTASLLKTLPELAPTQAPVQVYAAGAGCCAQASAVDRGGRHLGAVGPQVLSAGEQVGGAGRTGQQMRAVCADPVVGDVVQIKLREEDVVGYDGVCLFVARRPVGIKGDCLR